MKRYFLTPFGQTSPIGSIKSIRAFTGLSLKEAKDVVDAARNNPGAALDFSPYHWWNSGNHFKGDECIRVEGLNAKDKTVAQILRPALDELLEAEYWDEAISVIRTIKSVQ